MGAKYQAYSEYKDTGDNNLGNIPNHWHITKVKFISKCLDGSRIPLNAEQRGSMQGSIPYWGANSIVDYVDNHLFDEELVLLGEDGAPFFEPTKDVAFNVSGKIWPNNHVHVLRPDLKKISSKFLKYALNCVEYHLYITGSTRDKLNQSDMNEIFVRSCSVDEQKQIANFLDHETAKIDTLIDKQQQLIKLLKEKRQAVISHAVTKGLNSDAPMIDSGVEWLGEVPEHWVVVPIRRLLDRIQQGSSPLADNRTPDFTEEGVLKISAVKHGRFDEIESKTLDLETPIDPRYIVKMGDLLITRANTPKLVADACYVESEPTRKVMLCDLIYRLKTNHKIDNEFLCLCLLSEKGRLQIELDARGSSMTMAKVSQEHIKAWIFPIPPIDEQSEIVRQIKRRSAALDDTIDKASKVIGLLQERRTALISAAVTGKIDVRNWQPAQAENPRETSA